MVFKDYYKILGLESNKVSIDEIKIAYREMAKRYHPDINKQASGSDEIFKDINEAYRTLSNDKLRRKYDFNWNRYVGRKKGQKQREKRTIKEILAEIFLGGITKKKESKKKEPVYGENVTTQIDVSIDEAFFGVNKKVKLKAVNGKETSFNVRIPAGVQNHDKIRMVGHGKPGKNGGKNGDLLISINIKNSSKLKLVGEDLYTEIKLKSWEAALGTKKSIEVLNEKMLVVIPKGISSGEKIAIPQKGYKKGNGMRGNLNVITKIVIPKKLTEEEKNIYEKLRALEK